MAWNMTPVKASASAVNYPLSEIPQDVKDSVDEAFDYSQANPTERLVVTFADKDEADLNKIYIRSYCLSRPAGQLTASIWVGFAAVDENGNAGKFSQAETEAAKVAALSLFFTPYVKRSRAAASAGNGQPEGSAPPAE